MHVGMGLPQDTDFSVTSTPQRFTDPPKPIPAAPEIWASGQSPFTVKGIRARQCESGDLSRLATAAHPVICARPAHLTSKSSACRAWICTE